MTTNREKTTGIMGFVVSILLHGIFFAGCIAIDYSNMASTTSPDETEMNELVDNPVTESKS